MRVVSPFSAVASIAAALMFAAPTSAASADGPSGTSAKTRLIVLGTAAGPLPRKDRAQSAHAVVANGTTYLFDAGDGVARRLIQAGMTPMNVKSIFLTHGHDDHAAGLATLLSVAWDFQRKQPLDVYGPPGTAAIVTGAIQYMSVNAAIRWDEGRKTPLPQVFVGHDVGTGVVYQDANITVRAMENAHFHFTAESPAYGKYKSYSYRVEAPDRVIVFTGDTGPFPGLADLARNADVLVTEISSVAYVQKGLKRSGVWDAMNAAQQTAFLKHLAEEHLSADDVATLATGAHVKTVVLVHLPTSSIPNDDYAPFADEVKAHFAGTVVAAKDLMSF
ncbi:MAG TPA: MBL fold metallo-hydrolase [Stellaceae bacterium]|nr:MBL fold metallo-hydrolase [Stellaceae bacterium]